MKPSGGVFFVGKFSVTDSDFSFLFVPVLEYCLLSINVSIARKISH